MDILLFSMMSFLLFSGTGSLADTLSVQGNVPLASFVGVSARLTCSFSPTYPPLDTGKWISPAGVRIGSCSRSQCSTISPRYQLSLSTTGYTGTMDFTLNHTNRSDFGPYQCIVSTSGDTKLASLDLKIRECPMRLPMIVCSASVPFDSSSPLTVQCSDRFHDNRSYHHQTRYVIIHEPEPSTLHYSRGVTNSSLLTDSVNITRRSIPDAMEDQRLQIMSRCCRIEATLPCLATDGDLCSNFCTTTVLYPPSDLVLAQSPLEPWREGWRNASLTCRSNGFPPPRVSWMKVQEDTSPGIVLANGTGSSRLSFRELDRGQSGVYRCESHGFLQRTTAKSFNMSVQHPPEIDRRISSVHVNEGIVATLPCIVHANPSTPSMITWHNQNQSRIVSEDPFLIALVSLDGISGRLESKLSFIVDRKLFGNYSCTAKNTLGSDSLIIQLSGYSYPDSPYDLQVISYSDTSLTLSWTAGQDGGLPVTFTVTYCSNISQVERVSKMKQAIPTTQVVVTELRCYTSYSISLIAVNGVGNSKAGAEIIASTAPGTLAFYGITARYEMASGILKLSFSELRPLPPDLCIYAEFHVGGFRHRNETCLRPGQIGHIQNGARENQLWLVICGKGVCSTRSTATYTDGETDLWRLMVIVIPVFSCFVVCILLVLLVACIRRLIGRRRMAYQLDAIQPVKSPSECPPRILPSPPTKRSGDASESPNTPESTETIIGEGYEMMKIKCADKVPPVSYLLLGRAPPSVSNHPQRPPSGDDRALSASNQGYVPMDNTCLEGIYMTHLRHDLRPEVEDESTSGSGAPDLKTFPWTKEGIADDSDGDVNDIDSLNDTYAAGEHGESEVLHHEYLKASGSQASMFLETAL